MKAFKRGLLVGGALILLLLIVTALTYQIAGRPKSGFVAPRVQLAERNIGGLSSEQLSAVVAELAVDYQQEPMVVRRDERSSTISTDDFALQVTQPATVERALKVGRTGNYLSNVVSYFRSFAEPRSAAVVATFDDGALEKLLVDKDPGPRTPPTEPQLEFEEARMSVVEGEDGRGLTAETMAEALPSALRNGKPLVVRPSAGAVAPTLPLAHALEVAGQVNNRLSPIAVQVGTKATVLNPDRYGPWIETSVVNGEFTFKVEAATPEPELHALLPEATVAPIEPRFIVTNNQPQIVTGVEGQRCCAPSALPTLEPAIQRHIEGQLLEGPVLLSPVVVAPTATPTDLEALQIRQPVGTFTTGHAAGQNRVINIHRMADTVRGHVIKPGQTMSLNEVVGPRTTAKGYLEDGVISEAKFTKSVGGGVSQFATTLFNAAFFAGLDFGEYQAHTIYIDRYPYGREATISHPHPDLQIKNTTPYGVLVWPSYANTSITVTLYSTPHAVGAQTGQSETKVGECTRVRTERTRSFGDGRREVDAVYALYQPAEGVRC